MRAFALLLLLSACTHVHSNDHLQIFNANVLLDENCQINVNTLSGTVSHNFKFESGGDCRIVTHANTSIPVTYFINGSYILFIEKNHQEEDECYSENTAIGISKNQQLLTTPIIKKSGSCYQFQEVGAFEYFSTKLTNSTER